MLKEVIFAILVTGFCACAEYHIQANADYIAALQQGQEPLRFETMTNLESVQNIEISLFGSTGLFFTIEPSNKPRKAYFHTANERFILEWFALDFSEDLLYMSFETETKPVRKIQVSSKVFTMPTPDQTELFQDAKQNSVYVQLVTLQDINDLLNNDISKKIDTTLSIAWIKDFLEKDEKIETSLEKKTKSYGIQVFKGPPITIDAEVLLKLNLLVRRIKESIRVFSRVNTF